MAITTESANRVRQKAYERFYVANPGVFYTLKAFFLHLATNKANPDLQYVNVDGTSQSSDGGAADQVVANAACNLFVIFLSQKGLVTTWFQLADSSTATAKNGTDNISMDFPNATTKEDREILFPVGRTMANGITISETTTATGMTRTLKANRLDGFIILSAGLGN